MNMNAFANPDYRSMQLTIDLLNSNSDAELNAALLKWKGLSSDEQARQFARTIGILLGAIRQAANFRDARRVIDALRKRLSTELENAS